MNDKYYTSPDRFEFLRNIRNKSFKEGQITEQQLAEWNKYIDQCRDDDADPEKENEPSLEIDLRYSQYIANKCKSSDAYSQNLYAALCNNQFKKNNTLWSCSWRHAGGIVANLREEGDYINWYCSGTVAAHPYVPESMITEEIKQDITDLGWEIIHGVE